MLPHEIEPFANHHIQELESVRQLLLELELNSDEPVPGLMDARNKINGAKNALVRFRVCMADEVRQKERFRIQARDCRLNHK